MLAVAQVGRHSIAYRERGAGSPLVFLHGWPLDGREVAHQMNGLSDAHSVIAWDAPGAGASTDPHEGATLNDWADWLAEFVQMLDLDDVHIAGLSWGGGLALAFAHRHPDRVRSLVLMSAYAGWRGSLPDEEVRRRLALTLENMRRTPDESVPEMLKTLLPPGSPESLSTRLTSMLSDSHPAATRVALTAFADADLRPALGDVTAPTLMICGELDVRAPRQVWEPIHEAIPHSQLVLIPEVGHMVDMQAPQRCNDEIKRFVNEVDQVLSP